MHKALLADTADDKSVDNGEMGPVSSPRPARTRSGSVGSAAKMLRTIAESDTWGWLSWALPAAATFVVCMFGVTTPSLWTDELATLSAADRPLPELFDLLSHVDAGVGAYYVLVHGFVVLFGTSELVLRLPSVIAMTISAALISITARQLATGTSSNDAGMPAKQNTDAENPADKDALPQTSMQIGLAADRGLGALGARVALVAGLLFALTPSVTRYGQETRSYALVVMFTVASTCVLVAALRRSTWPRWAGYAVLIALLGASHPLALLLLPAHAVAVLWSGGPLRQVLKSKPLGQWLVATAAGLAAASPLLLIGFSQRGQVNWNPQPRILALAELPSNMFGTPIVGGFVAALAVWAVVNQYVKRPAILLAWALIPATALYLAGRFVAVWNPRYVLFVMPAFVILAAFALAQLRWRGLMAVGVVFVILATPQHEALRRPDARRIDGRAIAQVVANNVKPGDVFVFTPEADLWTAHDLMAHYLPDKLSRDRIPRDAMETTSAIEANDFVGRECSTLNDCERMLDNAPRVWVMRWARFVDKPLVGMDRDKATLLSRDYRPGHSWVMDDLAIVIFDRK